ncbi:hypothetical protein OS493_033619 [Desmophyllum pertusum]|uniref:Uncharacterized protein n=1 Tax=Desmophyllum pertusum TaxID=174260 RepID=A0A9W9YKC5_9CNID|nr:hypothetical protein OS493_033619 [Desmophyllum pertusum]
MYLKIAVQMAVLCLGLIALSEAATVVKQVGATVPATPEENDVICREIIVPGGKYITQYKVFTYYTTDENSPCRITARVGYSNYELRARIISPTKFTIDGKQQYNKACCYKCCYKSGGRG